MSERRDIALSCPSCSHNALPGPHKIFTFFVLGCPPPCAHWLAVDLCREGSGFVSGTSDTFFSLSEDKVSVSLGGLSWFLLVTLPPRSPCSSNMHEICPLYGLPAKNTKPALIYGPLSGCVQGKEGVRGIVLKVFVCRCSGEMKSSNQAVTGHLTQVGAGEMFSGIQEQLLEMCPLRSLSRYFRYEPLAFGIGLTLLHLLSLLGN